MREVTLVLVHSPLVGPLTWEPTAKRLRQLGYPVRVPSLAGIVGGAPAELSQHLLALARGDRLPRWNQWFPAEALSAEIGDASLRERFVAELPELAVAYFEERAPHVRSWPPARCGYVQLSEPYQDFADEASRAGWLVRREDADHLAVLTRPDLIAGILDEVATALAIG
jgi:hypothetical protein